MNVDLKNLPPLGLQGVLAGTALAFAGQNFGIILLVIVGLIIWRVIASFETKSDPIRARKVYGVGMLIGFITVTVMTINFIGALLITGVVLFLLHTGILQKVLQLVKLGVKLPH